MNREEVRVEALAFALDLLYDINTCLVATAAGPFVPDKDMSFVVDTAKAFEKFIVGAK